jgi:hypothetical protein
MRVGADLERQVLCELERSIQGGQQWDRRCRRLGWKVLESVSMIYAPACCSFEDGGVENGRL